MCFIEIGYYKSNIPLDKAASNALINGSEDKTNIILKKIVMKKMTKLIPYNKNLVKIKPYIPGKSKSKQNLKTPTY